MYGIFKYTVLFQFTVLANSAKSYGFAHHTTKEEEPQYHRKAVRYGTIILRTVGKKKGGASKKD